MTDRPEVTLRSIAPAAFLPPALFAIGQGAIAPVVVITARDLGASVAAAAFVVAMAGLGQIIADIPAGAIAHRFGERPAMIGASALTALALGACMWAPSLAVFTAAIFVTGMGTAVWQLARQAYVAEVVPFRLRARAMSTLGGVYRIGLFVGPFLGGAVVHLAGPAGAYGVSLVATAVAALVLMLVRDLTGDRVPVTVAAAPAGFRDMLHTQRHIFSTLGVGVLVISAVRASRQVVLPLWGDHLGLSPAAISVIFGISGAVDMLFFYPAGKVMDGYGRVWVAVPSMVVLGLAHLLLPLAATAGGLIAVGIVMGVGNGMGSGLVMTLGADLAPPGRRPMFFGIWRVCSDGGNAAGPFVLAGVTAVASLAVAIVTMGGIGLLGAGLLGY